MKDFLQHQVLREKDPLQQTNRIREYLQARILQSLQEQGAFLNWAFLGGTALRFLYGLPRYSEDIDFSLADPTRTVRFEEILRQVKTRFEHEGYAADIKVSRKKTVRSAFIKFSGLLHELGISPHKSEVFSIKLEVDTNPPAGAVTATTLSRRFVTVNLMHYDKASLLAGKLHAILSRPWAKGRDLYDLAWYLAERSWPEPNLTLLNAALKQTGWTGPVINQRNWRKEFLKRLSDLDWEKARSDVNPFLENERDLSLVTKDTISHLLSRDKFQRNKGR